GRTRQRIEAGLGQGTELELAVAISEVGEHVEGEPIGGLLVEGAKNSGTVFAARVALQQRVGLFTTVASEVAMQQVNHGPQVTTFFDVDLEQVAQVVQRRSGQAKVSLLLYRSGFGIALGDDDAAQVGAMLARRFLPDVFTNMLAKVDLALTVLGRQENSPAVLGHLDIVEVSPAIRLHADCSTQIDIHVLGGFRAHVLPPLQIVGLPVFKRALKRTVAGQVDVVGNLLGIVDTRHVLLLNSSVYRALIRGSNQSWPFRPCHTD